MAAPSGNGHHLRNGPRNGQDHAVPVFVLRKRDARFLSGCRWPHVVRFSGEQSSWLLLPCWVEYKSARCGRRSEGREVIDRSEQLRRNGTFAISQQIGGEFFHSRDKIIVVVFAMQAAKFKI